MGPVTSASRTGPRRAVLALVVCTAASRLLGFVRVAVIGAVFGAAGVADVLNAVFMIPNNLRKLLAEGALSAAVIPELAHALEQKGSDRATEPRDLVRRMLTLLTAVVVVLVVVAVVLARPVVGVVLDFPEQWKMDLAVELFRLVFPYLLLVSVGAVLMAALNCHDVFVIPALAPLLFSVNVIVAIVLFHRHWGLLAAGVGILAGGVGGVVGQLPVFLRRGYDLRPDFHWSDPRVRRIVRQWVPVVASASMFAISQQVAIVFASGLEDGSASALANAVVFWQLPFGIFSVSVVTAHFPRMSRYAAAGDTVALAGTFAAGLMMIVDLLLPPALFYLFFGEAVIRVALERMTFSAAGTALAGSVLAGYAVGLVGVGVFNFAQRYFFATRDYRSPFLAALLVAAIDIPLSLWLKETSLRVTGLAVANSLAFAAGAGALLVAARRRMPQLRSERLLGHLVRVVTANAILAALLWAMAEVVRPWWQAGSTLPNALLTMAVGACAVGATLALYRLLKLAWWRAT